MSRFELSIELQIWNSVYSKYLTSQPLHLRLGLGLGLGLGMYGYGWLWLHV